MCRYNSPKFYVSFYASSVRAFGSTSSGPVANTNDAISNALEADTSYSGGGTGTANALTDLRTKLASTCSDPDNVCVGILLTDGGPNSRPNTVAAATEFKNAIGKLAVLGIGNGVDNTNNEQVASPNLYFQTGGFNGLTALFEDVIEEVCNTN